ncbi:MAG: hypothetical protein IJ668_12370, partial [Selenomonadaceae bacterium]|nr:hypothetical protein [Selenomonadaceae bacterium]
MKAKVKDRGARLRCRRRALSMVGSQRLEDEDEKSGARLQTGRLARTMVSGSTIEGDGEKTGARLS